MATDEPSEVALEAFGLRDRPTRLEGGQGRTWVSGPVVLKPVGLIEEATWIAETLSHLPTNGFRIERPVRTVNGKWFADGWCGWERLQGEHDTKQRWDQVIQVTENFHQELQGLERPAFLDIRHSPWDAGDLAAWGGAVVALPAPIGPLVNDLCSSLRALDLPSQVIHGDMPRNVLFAEGLPPAVIDFSPYFRPAGFASAIVIVDALTWYGAEASILGLVRHVPEIDDLLIRAVIYRLVTTATAYPGDPVRLQREVDRHLPTLSHIRKFSAR